jgi:hypothetical protein
MQSTLPTGQLVSDQSDQSEFEKPRHILSEQDGHLMVSTRIKPLQPYPERPFLKTVSRFEVYASDNTGTNIAHVDYDQTLIQPPQEKDNDKWRNWLYKPSSPINSLTTVEGSQLSVELMISPGVSELNQPQHNFQHLRSSNRLDEMLSEKSAEINSTDARPMNIRSDSSKALAQYEEIVSKLRHLRESDSTQASSWSANRVVQEQSYNKGPLGHLLFKKREKESAVINDNICEGNRVQIVDMNLRGQSNCFRARDPGHQVVSFSSDASSVPIPAAVQLDRRHVEDMDPDQAWKSFVFGNEASDEVEKAAFGEAKHDVVKEMLSSDNLSAGMENKPSDADSIMATMGTVYAEESQTESKFELNSDVATLGTTHMQERDALTSSTGLDSSNTIPSTRVTAKRDVGFSDDNGTSESAAILALTEASAQATYHHSSVETHFSSSTSEQSTEISSLKASAGTYAPSEINGSTDSLDDSRPRSVESAESGASCLSSGPPSMITSMAAAPALSNVGVGDTTTPVEHFRFVPPKLFVGKRSNPSLWNRATMPNVGLSLTRRRQGRQRRRANDGRADIRALPNYSSDPIEDVDEEENTSKSRFPLKLS